MYQLPKKVNRLEAKVDDKVASWLMKHHPRDFALEVKVGKNKTSPHQDAALKQVVRGIFKYKLPDTGRRNPFDYIGLKTADAVVCTVVGKKVECSVNDTHTISFSI